MSIIFPAWMKYVYKSDIERFTQFAERVWNVNIYLDDLGKMAIEGIKNYEDFLKEIGLPSRLGQIGIHDDSLE